MVTQTTVYIYHCIYSFQTDTLYFHFYSIQIMIPIPILSFRCSLISRIYSNQNINTTANNRLSCLVVKTYISVNNYPSFGNTGSLVFL